MMEGLEKEGWRESVGLLTPVTSPPLFLYSSLCLTKSPLYLSASNVPTDSFVVNELSCIRCNFLNPYTQAHAGTHFPLTADLHFMSLTPHFLFRQPSANFSFQDNHFISLLRFCHQGFCWWYEVPKVLFFVSPVWDIGDEEKAMIANWLLMLCPQTVRPPTV